MSDLKKYNVIGCAGGEHCVCVDGYGHKKYAQTPIPQPLAEKDKHELVRIVEIMQEDVRWYVDQWNSLLAERDRLREENRRLNEALQWAMQHLRFPVVPDPTGTDPEHCWNGCPGCRVVWEREMQHKPDCAYIAARAAIHPEQGDTK